MPCSKTCMTHGMSALPAGRSKAWGGPSRLVLRSRERRARGQARCLYCSEFLTWLRYISLLLYAAWVAASQAAPGCRGLAGTAAGGGDAGGKDAAGAAAGAAAVACPAGCFDAAALPPGLTRVGCTTLRLGGRRAAAPEAEKEGLVAAAPAVGFPASAMRAAQAMCCCCCCCWFSRSGSGPVAVPAVLPL